MSNTLSIWLTKTSEALSLRRLNKPYGSKYLDFGRNYLRDLSDVTDFFLEETSKTPGFKKTEKWFYFKNSFHDDKVEKELLLVDNMLYGLERVIASNNKNTEHLESYFLRLGEVMFSQALEAERRENRTYL